MTNSSVLYVCRITCRSKDVTIRTLSGYNVLFRVKYFVRNNVLDETFEVSRNKRGKNQGFLDPSKAKLSLNGREQ